MQKVKQSARRRSTRIPAWRLTLRRIVRSDAFQYTFLFLIIVNAISLGLATSPSVRRITGDGQVIFDDVIIGLFILEFVLKIMAFGVRFFKSWWNIFDISVVSFSLLPQSGYLSVLRALRVMRAMRVLSFLPQYRQVMQALLDALPGMFSVMIVLALIYYVFAVMATGLFGASFPDWFGDIGRSLYSLFQIMTLESWSMGIVRPVMKIYPYAWALFIPFIFLTAFAVLNLFIGLIVSSMQGIYQEEHSEDVERLRLLVSAENRAIAHQLEAAQLQVIKTLERLEEQIENNKRDRDE
ncbi:MULTISPECIES: ion transporter [Pseudovibrio]|uniref:ion transporter n=1 Tax=Pseudovibrio TaxID=258255 RepID=UPI000186BA1C|nr:MULTISPECIES: ion transporter [Pseudovibrio]EEA96889.1 Ion transport protein [Pseudovibrio sp. JE062]